MPTYDVFASKPSGLPSEATSFGIELTPDYQLKATMEIVGFMIML